MALSGSVDFVIKATDLTSKPTQDIVSALKQLDQAQQDVVDSSGNVTKSTADLVSEQQALLKVTGELDKRLSDISKYEKNEEKIKGLSVALGEAKTKYSDFSTALFQAQEGGGKTAIDVATSNLKAASTAVTQTQRQLDTLTRQQEKLRTTSLARGGVDLTQGGTARSVTEAARETVEKQKQLNIQLQLYKAEQDQEVAANRRAEELKQAQAKESAEFQAKQSSVADQNKRNEYARMYSSLLDEQDAKLKEIADQEKAAAVAAASRAAEEKKAADQLERFQEIGARAALALDVSKHGQTSAGSTAASKSASAAVGATLDPLKAQLSTLAGVEAALTDVEVKIKEVGTTSGTAASKIETLTAQEKQLDQISKTLGAQAGFIDKLNTQNAAVDQARVRLEAAEAEVRKWAAAIQGASQPNEAMLVFLQQAQGRLQGATTSFNTQSATLARMRTEAQAAGVDVNKLTEEEARLTSVAQRTATSQRQVGEALTSAGKGGKGFLDTLDKITGGGRTTLSFTQRLRGEILSLTASYIGLQAAVRGVGKVLDAVNVSQSVKAQIAQTTDTAEEAKQQFAFLLSEAQRTSMSFESVAEGYRTMVRQAREFGLSQKATNKLFSDALTVSRSYNQTQEQLQGTMLALGQIFDKGTIQAQEFKQQLSNAGLAGLFPVLQKVMKDQGIDSVNDLRKAMAAGTISAANMGLVFDELAKSGQVAFGANMNTWSAQVGKFKTQLFVLENQFADSGFLVGVSEGLDRVSALLKDPATQENIKKLGKLIGDLIAGFAELATNTDVLKGVLTALEVFIAAKFLISGAKLYLLFQKLGPAIAAASGAVPGLTAALGVARTAGLWGAVVGVGIALGALLDQIPAVRREVEAFSNASFWDTLKANVKSMNVGGTLSTIVAQPFKLAGVGIGTGLAKLSDNDTEKNNKILEDNKETNRLLADINAQRKVILDAGEKATLGQINHLKQLDAQKKILLERLGVRSVAPPSPQTVSPEAKQDAADAEFRRLSEESNLSATSDLRLSIEKETNQKILKTQEDFLGFYKEKYKDGIDAAERTVANARKLNEKDQNEASTKLLASAEKNLADLRVAIQKRADLDYNASRQESGKKAQESAESFAHKEVTLHEQTNALKLASDRQLAELGAKIEDDSLKARLAAVDAEIAQINEKYAVQIRKNQDAINAGKKIGANTSGLQADNATLLALQKELDVRKANAETIATQKFDLDQAQKAEEAINQKLQLRSALLSAIEEQQKAGIISRGQAQEKSRAVNASTLGGEGGIDASIDAQVASLTKLIDKQIAAGQATSAYTQKLELLRAQMIALKASTDASAATMDQFSIVAGNAFSGAISSSITSFVQEIGKAGAGVESLGKAWATARDVMRNAVADMLQQIAIYIIKMQIVKALESASSSSGGGTWGSLFSAAASALGGGGSKAHTGAVVGAGGVGGATPMSINPAWFIGAPRFHTGGLPGLAPDEYPIIAQKGEEILSKDNPRNVMNGGRDGGNTSQVGQPGGDLNLHMHADAGSFFSAGLNTKRGQKDFFVFFEANRSKFSKLIR